MLKNTPMSIGPNLPWIILTWKRRRDKRRTWALHWAPWALQPFFTKQENSSEEKDNGVRIGNHGKNQPLSEAIETHLQNFSDLKGDPRNSMFDYPQEGVRMQQKNWCLPKTMFAALGCAARLPTISQYGSVRHRRLFGASMRKSVNIKV